MKQIYLIHYDAKDGDYFRSHTALKGAIESAKDWMEQTSECPEDWEALTSDSWKNCKTWESVTIHELDLEE